MKLPAALLPLALGLSLPAAAHRLESPKRIELRFSRARLVVSLRVAIDLVTSEGALVDRWDRNGDGALDEAEADAAAMSYARRAAGSLLVSTGGTPIDLRIDSTGGEGLRHLPANATHGEVTAVLSGGVPARAATFEVRDRPWEKRDRVAVSVSVEDGAIREASSGRIDSGRLLEATVGAGEVLRVTVERN